MKKYLSLVLCMLFVLDASAQSYYNRSHSGTNALVNNEEERYPGDGPLGRYFVGSGLDFGIAPQSQGTYFLCGISPFVGYKLTNSLAVGINTGFKYMSLTNAYRVPNAVNGSFDYKSARQYNYTIGAFTRMKVIQDYFVQAQYEYNISRRNGYSFNQALNRYEQIHKTEGVNSLLLGAGYNVGSEYGSVSISFLYDVLQNLPSNMYTHSSGKKVSKSPYASQIVYRVTYNFGY